MFKWNKILAMILSLLMVLGFCGILSGCAPKQEEAKYAVQVMLARREVKPQFGSIIGPFEEERWIVGVNGYSLRIEQEYDGKYYQYFVYQFNFPDHPTLHDVWFKYDNESAYVWYFFDLFDFSLYSYGGNPDSDVYDGGYTIAVGDKGKYEFWIDIAKDGGNYRGSTLCKKRRIYVTLTIS